MRMGLPRVHHIDACGLAPVELVLDALGRLGPGEQLCMLVEREPFGLYRALSDQAYAYCSNVIRADLYEVSIWIIVVFERQREAQEKADGTWIDPEDE